MSTSDKHQIFEHLISTYLYVARKSGFEYGEINNKYVISGIPSVIFNLLYLSRNDDLLSKVVKENIPCICFSQGELERDFAEIAKDTGLVQIDNVIANRFEILSDWIYEPSQNVKIARVQTDEELKWFDIIAGESNLHPKSFAHSFLREVAIDDEICELYLAYLGDKAVGTVMVSYVDKVAGIYWLAVLPEYRNKGIATLLTNYAINCAKLKGHGFIVAQNLTPSQSIFKKIGFNPSGTLPLYSYSGK